MWMSGQQTGYAWTLLSWQPILGAGPIGTKPKGVNPWSVSRVEETDERAGGLCTERESSKDGG